MLSRYLSSRFDVTRKQSGQSIVIVGFMIVVLFGGVGLTIDGANALYNNAQAERAAAAGALAGVVFMPNQFTTPVPAGTRNSATMRAQDEAKRNGFDTADPNVTVTAATVAGQPGWLSVTATKRINTFFMPIFGIANVQIGRTAVAGYLSAINIGQPGTQLGTTVSHLGGGGYYLLRTEGYGTDRQQGDPFTTNPCGEYGGINPCATDVHQFSGAADPVATAMGLPTAGGENFLVNIPAGGGSIWVYNAAFAPDGTKTVTTGPGPDTFTYHNPCENEAPSNVDDTTTWGHGRTCANTPPSSGIPNGGFQNGPWDTSPYEYHEADSGHPSGDRTNYSVMAYTIFQVPNPFFRNFDVAVSQMKVQPVNASNFDPAGDTAPTYTAVTQAGTPTITQTYSCSPLPCAGTATNMWTYHHWADPHRYNGSGDGGTVTLNNFGSITSDLPQGTYRLRIDTLDWQGNDPTGTGGNTNSIAHKGYAVAVSGPGAVSGPVACASCTISAWNDMTFYTPVNGTAFTVPIFALPKAYAGQTVVIDFYDVGDVGGSGNLSIDILDPDGGAIASPPSGKFIDIFDLGRSRLVANPAFTKACTQAGGGPEWITNASCTITHSSSANTATFIAYKSGGVNLYNGHWVHMEIPVRPNYNPAISDIYWKLRYNAPSGVTATDTLAVRIGLKGAPAHLLSS